MVNFIFTVCIDVATFHDDRNSTQVLVLQKSQWHYAVRSNYVFIAALYI